MKKLAIVVPTYNRAQTIENRLQYDQYLVNSSEIDLLVFDSSDNSETKGVVDRFIADGFDNLRYYPINSQMHPNEKFIAIYEMLENSGYDYVWLIHDHEWVNREILARICGELDRGHSFFCLDFKSDQYAYTEVCGHDDCLLQCAWITARVGACILSREQFVCNTDWDKIKKRALASGAINWSHVIYYYERLAQIDSPRIGFIKIPHNGIIRNNKTEMPSYYETQGLDIFCRQWGRAIQDLPRVYSNKKSVLKQQSHGIISADYLIRLREKSLYGIVKYLRYFKWFRMISPEKCMLFFRIAIWPKKRTAKLEKRLYAETIKSKNTHNYPCYIYGAGMLAKKCYEQLTRAEFPTEGFVVSDLEGNIESIDGKPVVEAKEFFRDRPGFLIIAVSDRACEEIKSSVDELIRNGYCLQYMDFYG